MTRPAVPLYPAVLRGCDLSRVHVYSVGFQWDGGTVTHG